MATESVTGTVHRGLSLADVDRAHELIHKATAIADLIGVAANAPDDLIDIAVPGGCWAIRGMLGELKTIIDGKAIATAENCHGNQ